MGGGRRLTANGESAAKPRWGGALAAAAEFFFPRACLVCEGALAATDRGVACGRCWSRVPLLPRPWCTRCGHPVAPARATDSHCVVCAAFPGAVTRARSVCWVPDSRSEPLLYALKYQGWPAVADGMADRMRRDAGAMLEGAATPTFIPVPLSTARHRERGYNQAERLAVALAARCGGAVFPHALVRQRDTVSQTQLTPEQRVVNVRGAFALRDAVPADFHARPLILVDDVLTTGATLNACADALMQSGASDIRYWTFGRARTRADRP